MISRTEVGSSELSGVISFICVANKHVGCSVTQMAPQPRPAKPRPWLIVAGTKPAFGFIRTEYTQAICRRIII